MSSLRKILTLSALIFSCFPMAAQTPDPVLVKNLPADPEPQTDQYTLFSFESGKIVPLSEMNTDHWDLGFKGTGLIVNGGKGRTGKSAAFLASGNFDAIKELPANANWQTDDTEKPAIPAGSGNGWYEYVFTTHEIKPIPGRVLFVKTAKGGIAKMEIISYYRDVEGETDAPGRFYTFRYVYEPEGSGKF